MAISYNTGSLKSSDITAQTSDAGVGQRPDARRIFNFGDRVAELTPEESPFFVYLNKVAQKLLPMTQCSVIWKTEIKSVFQIVLF